MVQEPVVSMVCSPQCKGHCILISTLCFCVFSRDMFLTIFFSASYKEAWYSQTAEISISFPDLMVCVVDITSQLMLLLPSHSVGPIVWVKNAAELWFPSIYQSQSCKVFLT